MGCLAGGQTLAAPVVPGPFEFVCRTRGHVTAGLPVGRGVRLLRCRNSNPTVRHRPGGRRGRLPRSRGRSPVSALGSARYCGWGTCLCAGFDSPGRAGTGGPFVFSEKKSRPPCATSSLPPLHLPCGAKWKGGVLRDRGCPVIAWWVAGRSSFRSAPFTFRHHAKWVSSCSAGGHGWLHPVTPVGPVFGPTHMWGIVALRNGDWFSPSDRLQGDFPVCDTQRVCMQAIFAQARSWLLARPEIGTVAGQPCRGIPLGGWVVLTRMPATAVGSTTAMARTARPQQRGVGAGRALGRIAGIQGEPSSGTRAARSCLLS
jgi:hypothetical protein